MKLIIREYLASLRERGELDAILPDLLSQLGMNVFSRPGRGTRQDGVDVAAVGKMDGKVQKVYLFTIKPGDLTRRDWYGGSVQDLRPSLAEILDAYIPNRLPAEHQEKDIVICICVGGDIQEQVRPQLEGFIKQHQQPNITFEEWNGDKLASLIQSSFLSEDLLPRNARSQLRKSLAMLDEPDTSYKHFAALIRSLSVVEHLKHTQRVTAIRQMSLCLWILFAWGREAGNMESAYRSSELTLLHAWKIVSFYAGKKNKPAQAVVSAFHSILSAYQQICSEYLAKCVLPHVRTRDGLSSAIRGSCSLDTNLKLFDVLGRLAMDGIWTYWFAQRCAEGQDDAQNRFLASYQEYAAATKALLSNNSALFLPIKDDQAIDICMAVYLLALDANNHNDIKTWLTEIMERATFAYRTHGLYPTNLSVYHELLDHPKTRDNEYRENVTSGSILYPMIALWAALFDFDDLYSKVAAFKEKHLQHCNFQFWYPDENTEATFYTNSDAHGATLSGVCVDRPKEELLRQAFAECDHSPHFRNLSAVTFGFWPLIAVACRHYRLPLPLHILEGLRKSAA